MSYLRIGGIIVLIVGMGLGVWTVYSRIIKNQATTYQRAEKIYNPTYHYDYHPLMGFGCMRIPAKDEIKK